MSEKTVYEAFVEIREDGSALAHVLDLPGCSAAGATEAEALVRVASQIAPHYAWLRRHDEYTPHVLGDATVVTREVVRLGAPGQRGGAFFSAAAVPVTNEDLDWYLALLDWAYTDLYASSHAWESAVVFGPDGRAARAVVQQVAQGQVWLISRLEEQPRVPLVDQLPGTPLGRLRQVWQASLARLRAASDVERARILEHDGERWSLRKVLDRSILLVIQAVGELTEHSPHA
jgi:predicted RNase H-like HicB family nuclease